MKNIGKEELIELIRGLASRGRNAKPIVLYQSYHSGPDLYIDLLWHKQYGHSFDSAPEDNNWYNSDQCKFFEAYLQHYDQKFVEWCLTWGKEKNKPVVILLEKSIIYYDEYGKEVSPFLLPDAERKVLTLRETVGEHTYSFLQQNFELYDYSENKELSRYILPRHLAMLEEKDIKNLANEYGLI